MAPTGNGKSQVMSQERSGPGSLKKESKTITLFGKELPTCGDDEMFRTDA